VDRVTRQTFTVAAHQVRALAGRRVALALAALPVLGIVGGTAIVISASLALVAVLCAFAIYACISVAQRQRRVAAEAANWEFVLDCDRIVLTSARPRPIVRAIDRPDYLRLLGSVEPTLHAAGVSSPAGCVLHCVRVPNFPHPTVRWFRTNSSEVLAWQLTGN
jgi:hypothetical protein